MYYRTKCSFVNPKKQTLIATVTYSPAILVPTYVDMEVERRTATCVGLIHVYIFNVPTAIGDTGVPSFLNPEY